MTTYQISQEIGALYALMTEHNEETGELLNSDEDLADFVKEIKQNKSEKLDKLQDLKAFMNKDIDAYDEKIAKLSARKKALLNDIERVKNLQLLLLDGEKCKTSEYTFYFMNNESINIDSSLKAENFLGDSNLVKVKTTYDFDKTAIKKAIKDGAEFDGIELVSKFSLAIR